MLVLKLVKGKNLNIGLCKRILSIYNEGNLQMLNNCKLYGSSLSCN